jgi:hypothetical protein
MGGMRDDWEGQTPCKTLWGFWRDSLGAAQRWVVCCAYARCICRVELLVTVMTGFTGCAEVGGEGQWVRCHASHTCASHTCRRLQDLLHRHDTLHAPSALSVIFHVLSDPLPLDTVYHRNPGAPTWCLLSCDYFCSGIHPPHLFSVL